MSADENSPIVEIFPNQVAGHSKLDGKTTYGMLRHEDKILKPITKLRCGDNEIDFYERVKNSKHRHLKELQCFIPEYFGVMTIPLQGKDLDCIVLEDLTTGYKEPCVMDIKIGRRTWDPLASFEKILNEQAKYVECKRELCFCIPGFQVFNIHNKQFFKYGRKYGKELNRTTAITALKTFLNAEDNRFCRALLVRFLSILWQIQLLMSQQRFYHFYSTSILMIYDANKLREVLMKEEEYEGEKHEDYTMLLDELCGDSKSKSWVTLKMVDFAHVFPEDHCDIDSNYLDGILNLIHILENFLIECK